MKKLFAVLFGLSFLIPSFAQKQELKLNLEAGGKYQQTSKMSMDMRMITGETSLNITSAITGSMEFKVNSTTDDVYEMDVCYMSVEVEMQTPLATITMSSDKNDFMSRVMSKLTNVPFQAKINRQGKVLEVRNIENIFSSIFDEFPQLSETQRKELENQMMNSFGNEAFRYSIETVMAVFPEKTVGPGDTWIVESNAKSGFNIGSTTTYTYVGEKDNYHIIVGSAEMKSTPTGELNSIGGTQYNLSGTTANEIHLDKTTGWVVYASITQTLSGDENVESQGKKTPSAVKKLQIYSTTTTTGK